MVSASFEGLGNWSIEANPVKVRKFYEVKQEQAGTIGDRDRLFEETLAEFEAIQTEYDSIRSLLIEGSELPSDKSGASYPANCLIVEGLRPLLLGLTSGQ